MLLQKSDIKSSMMKKASSYSTNWKYVFFSVKPRTFQLILNPEFLSGLVSSPSSQDFPNSEMAKHSVMIQQQDKSWDTHWNIVQWNSGMYIKIDSLMQIGVYNLPLRPTDFLKLWWYSKNVTGLRSLNVFFLSTTMDTWEHLSVVVLNRKKTSNTIPTTN